MRCFFCDGGLRNWEREDNPFTEHARWFPKCRYIREVKGNAFVDALSTRYARVQHLVSVYLVTCASLHAGFSDAHVTR